MDHGYFKDRISGYLDSELRDYEMEAMRRHLEECAECRGIYEDLRKLDLLVERHSGLDGDDYWEAQAQKIEARLGVDAGPEVTNIAGKRGWGFGWKLAAVAASVGVLTFIGLHQTEILKQDDGREPVTIQSPPAMTTAPSEPVSPEEQASSEKAQSSPGVQLSDPDKPEGNQSKESGGDAAGRTAAKKAETTVDAALKRSQTELDKSIMVQPEDKTGMEPSEPSAAAPMPQRTSPKALTDMPAFSDESAERYQAAEREESLVARMPMRLSPSLNLSGSSALTQVNAASPAARIVAGTLTAPEPLDRLTLADWIDRSDSLQTVWNDLSRARQSLAMPSRKDRTGFSDLHLVERQLIEAQFNVGRLAAGEDQTARHEAVGFLRRYVERPDARYRSTARMYLDQLAPGQSDD